ncbi:MAG: hypothetical protein BWY99_02829 [Synergistetes bacterium ADurb.BinA166]|nr:MAG: hypothetical protein BWY99_02829 [Synergistetes bacterium ADurb.BinA166]
MALKAAMDPSPGPPNVMTRPEWRPKGGPWGFAVDAIIAEARDSADPLVLDTPRMDRRTVMLRRSRRSSIA